MARKHIAAALTVGVVSLASAAVAGPAYAQAAGSLDPTFGTGGKVLTDLGDNSAGAQIQAVVSDAALQSNGDIVVSGNFGLVRYLPSGKLDTSFGTHGLATTTGSTAGLTTEPNGDWLAVGAGTTSIGVSTFEITRFTSAGTLDPTFGHDGVVTTTFPSASDGAAADAVLVEPDGDLLVRGQATLCNANGTVDAAFDNPPFTYTGAELAGFQSPGAVAVQPSGQIVIAGSSFKDTSVFGLARVDTNGSLDSTFGSAGVLTTSFQGDDGATAVLIQRNGDIVAVGFSENNTTGVTDIALAR